MTLTMANGRSLIRARWMVLLLLAIAVGALAGRPARAQSTPTVMVAQNATLGAILTDTNGYTLYIFMRDTAGAGVSNCTGGCARTWPPFQLPVGDLTLPDGVGGTLDVIMRDDGSPQVTYNGMPLYYYANDANPGDTNGEGIGNVWFAATPQ
jgi:predicted lipoprotein with Yx(FWY)xxD motif